MKDAGISNRETPAEEAREREEFPPVDTASPLPQDAAGRGGEEPLEDLNSRQTSHKTGGHSLLEKSSEGRDTDRSMPATHKVGGAFGKEPPDRPADPVDDGESQS